MYFDEQKLREYYADSPGDIALDDIDLKNVPRHVTLIMDGNGRWAKKRGLPRHKGHVAGVDSLREAVTTSVRLGLDVLSVYAFSTENWKRPQRPSSLTSLSQLDTPRPREGTCPGGATEQFRSELTHWPVACSLLCNSCLLDQK